MPTGAEPESPEREGSASASRGPGCSAFLAPLLVGLVAVAGGVMLARAVLRDAADSQRPLRVLDVSDDGHGGDPAVSPDGTRVAWARFREDGGADIAVRPVVGDRPARSLTSGPSVDRHPTWSPDGTRLAFVRVAAEGCRLVVAAVEGGGERDLAPCPDAELLGLDWSPDGRWLAHTRADAAGRRGLALLGVEDGAVRALTIPPDGASDAWPAFSPDGRLLAFVRSTGVGAGDLLRLDIGSGALLRLTRDRAGVRGVAWIGMGQGLVFASDRAGLSELFAVSAAGGTPRRVAGGHARLQQPSASRDGGLVAYEEWQDVVRLWRLPLGGGESEPLTPDAGARSVAPAVSPDGTRLAFASDRGGEWALWLAGADGSEPRRLGDAGDARLDRPRWSPDGRRLVAVAFTEGQADLYVADLEGGWRRLTTDPADDLAPAWSRDGRSVLFASGRGGRSAVWRVAVDGGAPVRLVGDDADAAMESPDGAWLYYSRAGRRGLWRRPVAGGAVETLLSEMPPGRSRAWVLVGSGLFYTAVVRGEAWLLRAEPDGSAARPIVSLPDGGWSVFDVSADGRWLYLSRTERSHSRIAALTREPGAGD